MTGAAHVLAAVSPLVVGAVLLWSGGLKVLGRHAADAARRSALASIVGAERAPRAHSVLGAAELGVAAALLAPVTPGVRAVGAGAAIALSAGFVAYLAYARAVVPESSCGCLSAKTSPVRGRSIARAGALLGLSAAAAAGVASDVPTWAAAAAGRPVAATVAVLSLAAVVVALSPELDDRWLLPLRRLRLRVSHPLAASASSFDVPVESTVHQLERSTAFAAASRWVRSDLVDTWDEGEWRVLTYGASHAGRPVTAVFAVPRTRYEPDAVRAVLVDGADEVVWEHRPVELAPA